MNELGATRSQLLERCQTAVAPTANSNRRDDDQVMLCLAIEKIPLGGPSEEEVWARFGFGLMSFWHRICYLLTCEQRLQLHPDTITELQDQAMRQFNPPR